MLTHSLTHIHTLTHIHSLKHTSSHTFLVGLGTRAIYETPKLYVIVLPTILATNLVPRVDILPNVSGLSFLASGNYNVAKQSYCNSH